MKNSERIARNRHKKALWRFAQRAFFIKQQLPPKQPCGRGGRKTI